MKLSVLLNDQQRRICEETGCDPERFGEIVLRKLAAQRGDDPDRVIATLKGQPEPTPKRTGCIHKYPKPSCKAGPGGCGGDCQKHRLNDLKGA